MDEKRVNKKAVLPIMLDAGAVAPTRAHATDAGLTEDEVKHIKTYVRKMYTRRHPEGLMMLTQVGY